MLDTQFPDVAEMLRDACEDLIAFAATSPRHLWHASAQNATALPTTATTRKRLAS